MSISGAGARRPGPRRFAQSGELELRDHTNHSMATRPVNSVTRHDDCDTDDFNLGRRSMTCVER